MYKKCSIIDFFIPALQVCPVNLAFPTHSLELGNKNQKMQKIGQHLTSKETDMKHYSATAHIHIAAQNNFRMPQNKKTKDQMQHQHQYGQKQTI